MSSFYFNLLSEFFEALTWRKLNLEPEDVHVLKDLADVFALTQSNSKTNEKLLLQGVMPINQFADMLTKSSRFGNLNDREFEIGLRNNLEELGLAFQSEIFCQNLCRVFDMANK